MAIRFILDPNRNQKTKFHEQSNKEVHYHYLSYVSEKLETFLILELIYYFSSIDPNSLELI